MRLTLALVSVIVLAVVTLQSLRFPGGAEARWAPWCLVAQFLFNSICLISAASLGWSSRVYAQAFYGLMAAVAVTAIVFSLDSLTNFPAPGMGMAVVVGFSTSIALVCLSFCVSLSRTRMLNWFSFAHVACAGVLLLCGMLTLTSLAFPDTLVSDVLRGAFGINWLCQGIYGLSECALYLRGRAEAVHHISFAPTAIIIVVFSILSIFLSGSQRELSRQSDAELSALVTAKN